jgi:hypothetical protein
VPRVLDYNFDCSIILSVAVTDDTVYGTKHVSIIFIQHSTVMAPDNITPPWFINANITPTMIATFAALIATGLLKNIGNASLRFIDVHLSEGNS